MKQGLFVVMAALVPGICLGQVPSLGGPEPGGAPHATTRAAGTPLRDGALAPGMLTVRIVQGGFTNNLPGQNVTVEVTGGKTQTAKTGPDGRAQFAHLPVGGTVRALATVGDERLTSETFEMPSESGVRLLLVVGDAAVIAPGTQVAQIPPPSIPAAPLAPATAVAGAAPLDSQANDTGAPSGVMVLRVIMASATVLAVGFLIFQRRSLSRRTPSEL